MPWAVSALTSGAANSNGLLHWLGIFEKLPQVLASSSAQLHATITCAGFSLIAPCT